MKQYREWNFDFIKMLEIEEMFKVIESVKVFIYLILSALFEI